MFTEFTKMINEATKSFRGMLSALFSLATVVGAVVIVGLSIVIMFCDEQSAQRYKHWRTNVIKATAVALCVSLIFSLIKSVFKNYWGQTKNIF